MNPLIDSASFFMMKPFLLEAIFLFLLQVVFLQMEDLCVQDFGNKYLSRATRPLGFQHLYKMFSLGILYEDSEVNLDSMQQVQA